MKSNLFIMILEELERNGVGEYVDISTILEKVYNVTESTTDDEKIIISGKIKESLKIMIDENFLRLSDDISLLGSKISGNLNWLAQVPIKATIKAQGLAYLIQDKNQKIIDAVNQSVIDTNVATKGFISFQKKVTKASIIISSVALGFSIIPIFKDNCKEVIILNKTLDVQLQKISKSLGDLKQSNTDTLKLHNK